MVILSLFLTPTKGFGIRKNEIKKIKTILSILAAMLAMSIVILIALAMSLMMFMLQKFTSLSRLNLMLVTLSSQFHTPKF
jgi:uncharacterized membrane protein